MILIDYGNQSRNGRHTATVQASHPDGTLIHQATVDIGDELDRLKFAKAVGNACTIDGAVEAVADKLRRKAEDENAPAPLEIFSASRMLAEYPELRKPLIDGIQRMTETCNFISAAKTGKTHTIIDLALCVVTGRAWLGRFPVLNPGPVLYVDAELHRETMSRRIATICSARGIMMDDIAGQFDVLSLRGKLRNIFDLAMALEAYAGKYRLIVLDALYRLVPPGIDENSNSDMTPVYNAIDQIAEKTGAAVIVVHHSSKGSQGSKSIVDVGSGASAAARATDTHLILRQHALDDCVVLDMAARSFKPIEPLALRWTYPVWTVDDTLDPNDLRQDGRRRKKVETEGDPEPEKPAWTAARFAELVGSKPKPKELILARAQQAGMTLRVAGQMLALAIDEQAIYQHPAPSKNDRKAYYANVISDVFSAAGNDCLSCAQPPSTPSRRKTAAGVGTGASEREVSR